MRDKIMENYYKITDTLWSNYNKVKVIDNYDYYKSNAYTIFYLRNTESFDEFKKVWKENIEECREKDYCYDDILDAFDSKAKSIFDYVELGTLDICTREDYELEI